MHFTFPLFLFVIARFCQEPTAKGHKKWWFPKAQISCCRSSLSGIIKAFACWCCQVAGCTAISSLFVSVAQHATNVEREHFGEVWGSIDQRYGPNHKFNFTQITSRKIIARRGLVVWCLSSEVLRIFDFLVKHWNRHYGPILVAWWHVFTTDRAIVRNRS